MTFMPGAREIRDPQAETERLAALRSKVAGMTQQPSVGRIVHVIVDPIQNNGTDVAPAVITRVWNEQGVNLRVLLDGESTLWRTSVPLYESRDALEAANAQMVISGGARPPLFGAFWPPRV
jgi:hypothetical protein